MSSFCHLLIFLKAYFKDRYQRVVLNGSHPEYFRIESGVLQGSVIGPLLFLVLVNKQAVEVLFTKKNSKQFHPSLYFNGNKIVRVNEHKHLGMILDCTLLFASHINEKIKITRKNIGILKYLSSYIPLKTLNQIHKFFIRLRFDHGDVIYHISNKRVCLIPQS